jgi:CheY-like chemotaxis protein
MRTVAVMAGDPKTMLIVEGDPRTARTMATHFEGLGYEVASAPDGLDAIRRIRSRPPRVVVMGLTTPRLGGLDAVRRLRRWRPDLSIVLADGARPSATGAAADPTHSWRWIDPLVARATEQPPDVAPPRIDPLATPAETSREDRPRVLVVDDDRDARDLLHDVLAGHGYDVAVAADARSALEALAGFRPRVVLLDIAMPGLSGVAALQHLRTRAPELGVIMVTANDDTGLARRTLALGAFDYVQKPIDFAYLRRSIDTFVLMRAELSDEPTRP